MSNREPRNPDDPDDAVTAMLIIKVRRNGSMSTEGHIDNEKYALAMLDNAKDAVRRYNARKAMNLGGKYIVPGHDTGLILPPSVRQ